MEENNMKTVAVVGTVGVPACYGGFESLVQNLIDYQSDGIQYQIFCSSKKYDKKFKNYKNAELIYLPINANGVSSIIYDIMCLIICLFKRPDVVLILGVSGCLFL
ncbi:TPA: glycosyltransferase family 1 protein, partial [Escherichia coli]|nr:glycosyltransferase family 1 protein [Escherichia coli]